MSQVPESEQPSIIFSTQADIRRVSMDGAPWKGNSTLRLLNTHALEFSHRNRTFCYIHNNFTESAFMCANIDNFNERWVMPTPEMFPNMECKYTFPLDRDVGFSH